MKSTESAQTVRVEAAQAGVPKLTPATLAADARGATEHGAEQHTPVATADAGVSADSAHSAREKLSEAAEAAQVSPEFTPASVAADAKGTTMLGLAAAQQRTRTAASHADIGDS